MNLRMAVLLTNDDNSAFAANFPNDGQKVVQLLQPLRPHWFFEVVSVKDGVLPSDPEAFDGYVITGSPASVNDDSLPWVRQLLDFIRAAHAVRRPLIGLCFGPGCGPGVGRAGGAQRRRLGSGHRPHKLACTAPLDDPPANHHHFDGRSQRTGHPHARGSRMPGWQ